MKIGIIGAGKVGVSFGKYLRDANVTVTGFFSKSNTSAQEAAEFTQTSFFETLEELTEASDTLFLTTPDGALEQVWDCIAKQQLTGKVISHFSGSVSSEIFRGIGQTGASGCSVHPMYAFSDKYTSYRQLHTAAMTMEGDTAAVEKMQQLFGEKLNHRIFTIKTEDKVRYHTAAVFASNYLNGLLEISVSLLEKCGFSQDESTFLLEPLVKNSIQNIFQSGTVQALTGPIERGDFVTVERHIRELAESDEVAKEVYLCLGQTLVLLAERRNPERDYTVLREMLIRQI